MSTATTPRAPNVPGPVTDYSRLLVGLIIATLGALFLLDAAGTLDAGEAISGWWPVVIVAAGLLTLAERPPSVLRGAVLTGAGVLLLLFTTDTLGEEAWAYVWPAALVLAGLLIVARWRGRPTAAPPGRPEDVVRASAIFSGARIVSSAQDFRGAWLTGVFGGVTLDLRAAQLSPGGASVNATTLFGGVEVLVPRGWRLSVRTTPIFGGLDDKTDHSVVPDEDAPLLQIDAVTIFGGVEIKHDKDD
jgi:hypothetical protein